MKQLICPIDGKLCDPKCPDRYHDQPEGGCFLTTAQEPGFQIMDLGDGWGGMLYVPSQRREDADQ